MGSFDCYCALCSGPLNIGAMSFGSRKLKSLKKRREQVAEALRARKDIESRTGSDINNDQEDQEMEDVQDANKSEDDRISQISNPFAKPEEASWGDTDDEEEDEEMRSDYASSDSSSDGVSIRSMDSDFYPEGVTDVRRRTPTPSPPDPRSLRDPDCWSQWSEPSLWEGFNPYKSRDDDDSNSVDSYRESRSYDPEKLPADEVRWLNRCRALCFNPDAPGITKAFICGRGRYGDLADFNVKIPGIDPNDTGEQSLVCFHAYNADETPAYPFHEECYKVLARALGYKKYQVINKDVLYGVMTAFADDRGLELPYGNITGPEQFWDCIPGEEFSVCDPGLRIGYEHVLQSMLPASLFAGDAGLSVPSHKVRHDPFHVMPYDILLSLFEHIAVDDVLALTSASTHVLGTTRNGTFWKYMLRLHILPWFWELRTLLDITTLPDHFDYKGLFIWVYSITSPECGMEGPLMGIANRRRIWDACKPLVPLYKKLVAPTLHAEPEDEEAKVILDRAESFHMPIVRYPLPKGATTVSAQFIRSWHEIAHRACDFDTYWNADGALVGIAVTFGTDRRVLGSIDGTRGLPLHIDTHEWIQEIRLMLGDCDMFDPKIDRSHWSSALDVQASGAGQSQVEAMEIILTSGRSKIVKMGGHNIRPFVVLPDMHFIGLTGQVAPNGVISRLGLLQSRHPEHNPRTPKPSYSPIQKTLWGPSGLQVYVNPSSQLHSPIWQSSFYNLHTFTSEPAGSDGGDLPSAMLPHHLLLWSKTPEELKFLRSIAAFVIEAGVESSGTERWPIPDVLGFAAFHAGENRATQHIGTFGPVPSQSPEWTKESWYGSSKAVDEEGKPTKPLNPTDLDLSFKFQPFDENYMCHFDIDGPGGEEVSEIQVSADYKAIKLKTNMGRECYWGEGNRSQWYSKVASEGECIVGLSACFGVLGGWSWEAKMYSHWKLSELGVVLARRDGRMWG